MSKLLIPYPLTLSFSLMAKYNLKWEIKVRNLLDFKNKQPESTRETLKLKPSVRRLYLHLSYKN